MTNKLLFSKTIIALVLCLMIKSCKKDETIKVTASFTTDKESGDSPLSIQFTNTSINAITYLWDFGDGTTSNEKDPVHSFTNISTTEAASITVTLTAIGAENKMDNSSKTIIVNRLMVLVTASFTADKESGDSPLSVKFTNTSTNAVSYKWDFGDGTSSTEKDPTHSFTNSSAISVASITVTLTSTGANSTTANSTKVISINKLATNGKTTAVFNPNLIYDTMTDIDGNVYKTITIGNQTWMAENLRTTKYNDGTTIPNITDNTAWKVLTTGAYCTYNNSSDAVSIATYGRLYNWYAINDSRSIAPLGWHIPSFTEWQTLSDNLAGNSVSGGKLKEVGTTHWNNPNTGATNETGFTGLPCGFRDVNAIFMEKGNWASWWYSTSMDAMTSYVLILFNDDDDFGQHYASKVNGLAVRCIKD